KLWPTSSKTAGSRKWFFKGLPVENARDPTTAKARAYLQAVTFGEEIGFSDAVVEGNALTVIKKLKSKRLSFKHTPRTLKGAAHILAARGRRYNVLIFWMEEKTRWRQVRATSSCKRDVQKRNVVRVRRWRRHKPRQMF
ncbi:hypothetical protein Gogos_010499, partial [Gossypium gossypioides]|nr:hypothetical protein [Gossypium gossypioides]